MPVNSRFGPGRRRYSTDVPRRGERAGLSERGAFFRAAAGYSKLHSFDMRQRMTATKDKIRFNGARNTVSGLRTDKLSLFSIHFSHGSFKLWQLWESLPLGVTLVLHCCYNSGLDFGCEPSTQLGRPKDHLGGRDGRVSLAIFGGLSACRFALDKGLV